jgi:formylglycine-generating enzyme required for sulfatase activity
VSVDIGGEGERDMVGGSFGAAARFALVAFAVANVSCGGGDAAVAVPSTPCRSQPRAGEVCIKGGVFVMGHDLVPVTDATVHQPQLQAPPHHVRLRPFFLDERPVSNGEYLACVTAGVCPDECQAAGTKNSVNQPGCEGWDGGAFFDGYHIRDPLLDRYPVVSVYDVGAEAYCGWTGKRLPTEAEWERAARGPAGTDYPWGDQAPDCSRWGCDLVAPANEPFPFWPVGTYPVDRITGDVTPEGARMMVTGVPEFLHDWPYTYPYDSGDPIPDPLGDPPGEFGQTLRGNLAVWLPPVTPRSTYVESFPQPAWATTNGHVSRSSFNGGIRCARTDEMVDAASSRRSRAGSTTTSRPASSIRR